jgi:hypothetical protein
LADGARSSVRTEARHDATLIGVALAGIISVLVTEDEWDLFDSMVGVVLLLVLLAYGKFRREAVGSRLEAAAVGAVFAFCAILVIGVVIDQFARWLGWPPEPLARGALDGFWFVAVWLVLTVVIAVLLRTWGERLVRPALRRPAPTEQVITS